MAVGHRRCRRHHDDADDQLELLVAVGKAAAMAPCGRQHLELVVLVVVVEVSSSASQVALSGGSVRWLRWLQQLMLQRLRALLGFWIRHTRHP